MGTGGKMLNYGIWFKIRDLLGDHVFVHGASFVVLKFGISWNRGS